MAIIVNGTACRTLNQPIYVNGSKIRHAYCNGVHCYPDDLPQGAYVLQLSGSVTITFEQSVIVNDKYNYSWWNGWSDTKFSSSSCSMTGKATVTVVSKRPIAVFNVPIPIDTADLTSEFGGQVGEYKGYTWIPRGTGRTRDFPLLNASVGYQLSSGTSTGHDESPVCECSADAHVSYAVWGWNTASAMNAIEGGGALSWAYPDNPRTNVAWMVARTREYVKGYHDSSGSWENDMTSSEITYDGGYVREINGYPTWEYFLSSCGRQHEQRFRPDGTSYVDSSLGLVSNRCVCGYRLRTRIPCTVRPLWAQESDGLFTRTVCWVPFTSVDYNNNPPISSPTFSTDPPTSEASDDYRAPVEMRHPGLN